MKRIFIMITLLLFAVAGFSQATKKDHIEIYALNKALGINVPAGSLVYRADSNFWMIVDSAYAKADSGTTILREGYYRLQYDDNYIKYGMTADTASTKLRNGSMRLTNLNLWIKRNGTWKKLVLQ